MRKKLFNNFFFWNEVHDEGKQSEKMIFMSEYEKSHADYIDGLNVTEGNESK